MADNPFFEHPILNAPYAEPKRHWELHASGQPSLCHRKGTCFRQPASQAHTLSLCPVMLTPFVA